MIDSRDPHPPTPLRGAGPSLSQRERCNRLAVPFVLLFALAACASQIDAGVAKEAATPGFWWGLWHGFVFPFAWIGSLFDEGIAVYAVPNTGGWYDFGFFLGVTVLGGGSWFSSKRKRG
jgi:LPXTG-motif cell wall-anchored protein